MLGILSEGGQMNQSPALCHSDENKVQDYDERGLLGRSPSRDRDHANRSRRDEC